MKRWLASFQIGRLLIDCFVWSLMCVVSFSRRSLISNEQKYRQSLEYRMFIAENPDYSKDQSAQNLQ